MEYRLDNYSRQPGLLTQRLAQNCKRRRLDKGLSRRALAEITGVPAPTIEHFENTGKISLEPFCALAIEFDYHDEMASILQKTKYSTSEELEAINQNRNRKNGR